MTPRPILPLLLLSALIVTSCKKEKEVVEEKPDPSSPAALSEAAARTGVRLTEEPAHWIAIHSLETGDRMEVAILQDPPRRRVDFTLLRGDERLPIAHIVDKDRRWYVTDGGISGVYRPFMAPLRNPALYLYLARSELQFFREVGAAGVGPLAEVKDGAAVFRIPFPEEVKEELEARAVVADEAEDPIAAEAARSAAQTGLQTNVNLETGVITRAGLPGLQVVIDGPYFHERPIDEAPFETGDAAPGLLASSIEEHTDTLVMLGHCLVWRPGQPACDLDTHLLELGSGALRRVPFIGGTSLPGTFLENRTEVVVVGTDVAGGMRPFRVHLETGAQFALGGGPLSEGITLFPTLSPDGKTLAATWMPAMGAHDEARVVRFDLEGGHATPVGEPVAHSHVQWLPSGEGFLLVLRETAAESGDDAAEETAVLATMTLEGEVKRLREGDQPVILGEDAMLFFDVKAKRWQRAKLDGTVVGRFGNGHADLSHPTASPDGKSLIFLRRNDNGVLEPVRVDAAGTKVTSVMSEHGLWAWPRW